VALVVFDPGVEARLREALAHAARRVEEDPESLGLELEVALARSERGAREDELVVVGRHALDEPEGARVDLAVVVERSERRRAEALAVPEMEILVGHERQAALVLLLLPQPRARVLDRRRVLVLEAALAAREQVEDE